MSPLSERKLDRQVYFDQRSWAYPMRAVLPAPERSLLQRTAVQWKPGIMLDQGREGACVGFGWTQEAVMSPVRVPIADISQRLWIGNGPNSVAMAVYKLCQLKDREMGNNWAEGASVLAGAKAMTELGYLREYRWCFDITDVIQTLIHFGPVVLGINWHYSMYFPDIYGELQTDGDVVGGHCIVASGYHPGKILHPSAGRPARPMVQLTNSWGPGWGKGGQAWIGVPQLAALLGDNGEACVPVHRSYGRQLAQGVTP